jgi:hypothetical protein
VEQRTAQEELIVPEEVVEVVVAVVVEGVAGVAVAGLAIHPSRKL